MIYMRFLGLLWFFFTFNPAFVCAQGSDSTDPMEIAQKAVGQIRVIFRDQITPEKKGEILRNILVPHFDFDSITRSSLGQNWKKLGTEKQQQEVIQEFRARLIHRYVRFVEYIAWADSVEFLLREEDTTHRTVETMLIVDQRETHSVDYKFHLVNGKWKMYDVRFNGMSQVNNFRGKFNRKLSNESPERIFHVVIDFIKILLPGV